MHLAYPQKAQNSVTLYETLIYCNIFHLFWLFVYCYPFNSIPWSILIWNIGICVEMDGQRKKEVASAQIFHFFAEYLYPNHALVAGMPMICTREIASAQIFFQYSYLMITLPCTQLSFAFVNCIASMKTSTTSIWRLFGEIEFFKNLLDLLKSGNLDSILHDKVLEGQELIRNTCIAWWRFRWLSSHSFLTKTMHVGFIVTWRWQPMATLNLKWSFFTWTFGRHIHTVGFSGTGKASQCHYGQWTWTHETLWVLKEAWTSAKTPSSQTDLQLKKITARCLQMVDRRLHDKKTLEKLHTDIVKYFHRIRVKKF